ncbi:MAG: NUDIX hydrolase [Patescibacteria group bacterium]|nr:NUDIX hydrolase [Patescibacteria group bacterium]MDD4304039.1 NUDIX hydrolase [Patescibacteria group bacterium]MDD4694916.1 NUDIX hydrolase [Patescibacteria group bacterium]
MKKIILPKRLSRDIIYKSPWINLYTDKILFPSGKIIEKYHFLDYIKGSVVILLQNTKKEILFIESLRYTAQRIELELPAGHIEEGESILKTAKREVEEETGYMTKDLKIVYSFNPSNAISNQVVHVVFGKISDKLQKSFDTDEVKNVKWISKTEIKKLIKQKKIKCGVSLIPILLYLAEI